jgi:hypothetical protein
MSFDVCELSSFSGFVRSVIGRVLEYISDTKVGTAVTKFKSVRNFMKMRIGVLFASRGGCDCASRRPVKRGPEWLRCLIFVFLCRDQHNSGRRARIGFKEFLHEAKRRVVFLLRV